MPRIVWRLEDAYITLVDRARLGVTLEVPGQPPLAIPPLVLGAWPFSLGERALELRSVRNLDRLRYQLFCEGHLLPRGPVDRRGPLGAVCEAHASEPAICLCTRCRRATCKRCSPNGIHCVPCLDALAEEDRLAAIRVRRLGIGASIAIGLAFLAVGKAAHSEAMLEGGVGVLFLVVFLYARGLWSERRERKAGFPSAIDR
jgi:hypothetical protein